MANLTNLNLQSIVNLFKSTSKDEIRYQLTQVNMRSNGSREVILEACDGHKLAQINIGVIDGLSEFLENKNIGFAKEDIESIKHFLKMIGLKKGVERDLTIVSVAMPNPSQRLTLKLEGMPYELKIGLINDNYPKTDHVMTDHSNTLDENKATIAFNVEYLKDLYESLKGSNNNGHVQITFDKSNKLSPIAITIDGKKATLMPVRF